MLVCWILHALLALVSLRAREILARRMNLIESKGSERFIAISLLVFPQVNAEDSVS